MCPECGGEYGHSSWCREAERYAAQSKLSDVKDSSRKWEKRAIVAEAKTKDLQTKLSRILNSLPASGCSCGRCAIVESVKREMLGG